MAYRDEQLPVVGAKAGGDEPDGSRSRVWWMRRLGPKPHRTKLGRQQGGAEQGSHASGGPWMVVAPKVLGFQHVATRGLESANQGQESRATKKRFVRGYLAVVRR